MKNIMKTIKKEKAQEIIILALIFLSMLILNFMTPLLADDYSYALNLNNEKLTGLIDIINFQVNHYFTWGGENSCSYNSTNFFTFP